MESHSDITRKRIFLQHLQKDKKKKLTRRLPRDLAILEELHENLNNADYSLHVTSFSHIVHGKWTAFI